MQNILRYWCLRVAYWTLRLASQVRFPPKFYNFSARTSGIEVIEISNKCLTKMRWVIRQSELTISKASAQRKTDEKTTGLDGCTRNRACKLSV